MNFPELLQEKKLIQHFTDFFDEHRPKRKTSTNQNYGVRLNGLVRSGIVKNEEHFADYDLIINFLKDKPPTTTANTLTAVMDYLDASDNKKHNDLVKQYKKVRDLNTEMYLKSHQQSAFTKNQKNNEVSYKDLVSYYKLIKDIVNKQDYEKAEIKWTNNTVSTPAIDYLNMRLLLRLYLMHPSRNEYADLVMISVKDFNKIQHPMKNYIVFTDRQPCFLSINIYKTMDKYGEKRTPIKDKELIKWIRFHKNRFGYMEQMFYLQNGVGYTPMKMAQQLTKISKRHLGKSISSTMIYKIIIKELSSKYNKALENEDLENLEKYRDDLEEFAKTRGHSMKTQQAIYAD